MRSFQQDKTSSVRIDYMLDGFNLQTLATVASQEFILTPIQWACTLQLGSDVLFRLFSTEKKQTNKKPNVCSLRL